MNTQDYYSVGPGFLGFVATFFLAVALVLLYRSLTRHLRKVRRDQQQAQAQAATSGGVEDGDRGGDVVADEPDDRQ